MQCEGLEQCIQPHEESAHIDRPLTRGRGLLSPRRLESADDSVKKVGGTPLEGADSAPLAIWKESKGIGRRFESR